MEAQNLGTVVISNYASLILGIKNVEGFTNAARLTIQDCLINRGDFMAKPEPSPEPKRKRA